MRFERWLNTRTNLLWVFGILIVGLFAIYIASYSVLSDYTWIRESIGFIGGIASLLGILFTLLQILKTKADVENVRVISEATKKTAEETKSSIKKTFSIINITKYCEQIRRIQEYLSKDELKLVIHITQELQEIIIELKTFLESLNINIEQYNLSHHIKALGMNIGCIRQGLETNSTKIKIKSIIKDFDDLHEAMIEIKTILKE